MEVTKQQIVNGIVKYAELEVIDKILDRSFKIIIAIAVKALEANPNLIDPILDNSMVSTLLNKTSKGTYNLDAISDIIQSTINEYGAFPLKLPAIKFISPEEKELNFNSDDIRKLKECIENQSTEMAVNSVKSSMI